MRVLLLLGLFLQLLVVSGRGQPSHIDVYKALIKDLENQVSQEIRGIEGDTLTGIIPDVNKQANGLILVLEAPEFEYVKQADRQYVRTVLLAYRLQDSASSRGGTVQVQDTGSVSIFRTQRREAIPLLKGGPITPMGKFLKPAMIVAGSIGGILVLFRLRSQ